MKQLLLSLVFTTIAACTVYAQPSVTLNATNQSICKGNSTTLELTVNSAVALKSLAWSDPGLPTDLPTIGTNKSIPITPANTTIYTVTVTDINDMTNAQNITITVNALPTVSVSNVSVCPGSSASITAAGAGAGGSYLWNNSTMAATLTINPAVAGTYTVTATDNRGCTDTEQGVITINAAPTVNAGEDIFICKTDAAFLIATSSTATGYQWAGDAGTNLTSPTAAMAGGTLVITAISADAPHIYTVSVTDANGCTAEDEIQVTFQAQCRPTITVTPQKTSLCIGESTVISVAITSQKAINTASVTWSDGGSVTALTVTGSIPNYTATVTVNPNVSTTYTVKASDNTGSEGTGVGSIGVLSSQAISLTGFRDCKDDQNTLTPTQNASWTYAWAAGAGGYVSPTNSSTPTVSYLTPEAVVVDENVTYTVTVTDANTCTATASAVVTYEFVCRPYVYLKSDNTEICVGQTTNVWAETSSQKGVKSLIWSDPSFNPIPPITPGIGPKYTINPNTTVTYTVIVEDNDGDTNSDQIVITVNPLPTANLGLDLSLCYGNDTTLSEFNPGMIYTWSHSSSNYQTIIVLPLNTTTYTVTVTDQNGCSNSDDLVVTVNLPPIMTWGYLSDVCMSTNNILLSGGGPSGGEYFGSYVDRNTDTFRPQIANVGTHTIYYRYTNANGCTDTIAQSIEVLPLPAVSVADIHICNGSSATLSAGNTSRIYLWNDGSTMNMRSESPSTTTQYTVTVTEMGGCTASDDITITVIDCDKRIMTQDAKDKISTSDYITSPTLKSCVINKSLKVDSAVINKVLNPGSGTATVEWYYWQNGVQYTLTSNPHSLKDGWQVIEQIIICESKSGNADTTIFVDAVNITLTGLAENAVATSSLNLHPNPTTGIIQMDLSYFDEPVQLTFYNAIGEIVKEEVSEPSAIYQTNLVGLSAGIVFIRITTAHESLIQKVIVR